jgi:predicted nucleic acid-binding protein
MFPAPFPVVVDADALIPMTVCDVLLHAASARVFQLYWSEEILREVERNLPNVGVSPEAARRRCAQMRLFFAEAMVTGHEHLIPSMPNHPKDRHVAAAASKVGAELIVTNNLRDFRALPEGMEAKSPDDFLCDLFDLDPTGFVRDVLVPLTKRKRRPPMTLEEWLTRASKTLPAFTAAVALRMSFATAGPAATEPSAPSPDSDESAQAAVNSEETPGGSSAPPRGHLRII